MRFLNCDKVLCLAAHPDDVEYGMLGSIMKYTDTQFDILVLSEGGNFDESTSTDRHRECESIWEDIDNIQGSFLPIKHLSNISEDELSLYKIPNENSKIRIFHTFDKWECFKAGFYKNDHTELSHKECEKEFVRILSDNDLFENILKKKISLTKRDNLSKHVCEIIINLLLILL